MRLLAVTVSFLVLLAGGCSESPDPPDKEALLQTLKSECPLSFREVLDKGKLATQPFIRPEHVARLDVAPKLSPEADPAMLVTLTAQGERRMLSYTKSSVGRSIAAFCGDTEVSRATIFEPFGNHFQVALRAPGGT